MHQRRTLAAIALLVLVAVLGSVPGWGGVTSVALADPGADFEMAMDYPSIVAEPGKTVNLNLRLMNRAAISHSFDFTVTKAPDGWTANIKQGSYAIRSAYIGPQENKILTFEASPPDNAQPGDYTFVIKADSKTGLSQTVTLNIGLSNKVVSGTKVTSQYPVLTGPTGNKFEFKIDVNNGTGQDQSYNLSANAPQGWVVSFQPAYEQTQISSIRIKAGESSGVNVQVQSPKQATAGDYPIDLQVSAGGEKISGALKVTLTGTYDMSIGTDSGRLNIDATAGNNTIMTMLVANSGSADLKGVSFTSSKPTGWNVSFDPKTVDVPAGTTRELKVFVQPDEKAIAGDYLVTVSASTPQVNKTADVRVTVETPTVWGWVGIAIVLIVLGGLYGIFKTFSRR